MGCVVTSSKWVYFHFLLKGRTKIFGVQFPKTQNNMIKLYNLEKFLLYNFQKDNKKNNYLPIYWACVVTKITRRVMVMVRAQTVRADQGSIPRGPKHKLYN